jgi:hypothetical protein
VLDYEPLLSGTRIGQYRVLSAGKSLIGNWIELADDAFDSVWPFCGKWYGIFRRLWRLSKRQPLIKAICP